ncbi:hypothetical protein PENFLA_c010G05825 [Penicillium flavigenum]|uniref:NmrA-like domain-containing protein n=1 Tax=Penicillium flavigenum TaxID=254877 RepID=A0A1V6TDA5_9EURO|nr:hypothetical protein PENFLA_c010G05825 [Penicillium flavigenum]
MGSSSPGQGKNRKSQYRLFSGALVFLYQAVVVVSAVGASAFGEQKKFVDAAVRPGVKRFIPSEFSANSQNDAMVQLLPLFGQKKQLIEYLKSKETDRLTWAGIATSGFFDWGLANGFLEFDSASRTATIWDGGNKSFTLTNQKALGEAVASVLVHPHESRNQFLFITSVETTQKDILAALEEESGVKWAVNETTTNIQVKGKSRSLQPGTLMALFLWFGPLFLATPRVFTQTMPKRRSWQCVGTWNGNSQRRCQARAQ